MWRTKLCGLFGCQQRAELKLAGGEATAFRQLLELGCGEKVVLDGGLEELMSLGRMAHRYQLELVQCAVEDAVLSRHLTVESCGSVLAGSFGNGLERLARAGPELVLREFDAFSRTDGLMALDEEVLGSLLDDDELTSEREERVFEALVRWMKAGSDGRGLRGEGLLLKIRFPFMDSMYLADLASRPAVDGAGLDGLLLDSSTLRGVPRHLWAGRQLRFLDARALAPRGRVRWEDYAAAGGGERRLAAGQWVCRVAAHGGYVCGGLRDGSIRVWGRSTLEEERTLIGHTSHVWALLWARGRLVSGSLDRSVRVWDVAAGRCEGVLEGHTDRVTALAESGGRLLSGSWDGTVRVWRAEGAASAWRCEGSLNGGSAVYSLAAWGGRAASGSDDGGIRIWEVETGALERTLAGHTNTVYALAVAGRRLIRAAAPPATRRCGSGPRRRGGARRRCGPTPPSRRCSVLRLAVAGSTLVGGSYAEPSSPLDRHEVRVWDLETLQPLHALRQPAGRAVRGLVSDGGEVWGAVGRRVVVWGWRG